MLNEIYEAVICRILTEARPRLQPAASAATRKILSQVISNIEKINRKRPDKEGNRSTQFQDKITRIIDDVEGPTTVPLNVSLVVKPKDRDIVTIEADVAGGRNDINMEIIVYSKTGKFENIHIPMVQEQLYYVARHELQHLVQPEEMTAGTGEAAQNFLKDPKNLDNKLSYYLHPAEVEAWTTGIYYMAKKKRMPFIEVVNDILKRIGMGWLSKGATLEEIKKSLRPIRSAWITYAKNRFPMAKF